jgi:hypothetical protein
MINYRWILEDMFGYPKEIISNMSDEECREKAIKEQSTIDRCENCGDVLKDNIIHKCDGK